MSVIDERGNPITVVALGVRGATIVYTECDDVEDAERQGDWWKQHGQAEPLGITVANELVRVYGLRSGWRAPRLSDVYTFMRRGISLDTSGWTA